MERSAKRTSRKRSLVTLLACRGPCFVSRSCVSGDGVVGHSACFERCLFCYSHINTTGIPSPSIFSCNYICHVSSSVPSRIGLCPSCLCLYRPIITLAEFFVACFFGFSASFSSIMQAPPFSSEAYASRSRASSQTKATDNATDSLAFGQSPRHAIITNCLACTAQGVAAHPCAASFAVVFDFAFSPTGNLATGFASVLLGI